MYSKIKIKPLAGLLCFLLLITAFLLMGSVKAEAAGNVVASGTCGYYGASNPKWKYTDDGTLTIYGTGETDLRGLAAPWASYKTQIKKVVVEEGITAIGSWTFSDLAILTDVTIADSVKRIDERAFNYCTSLEELDLPDGLTSIGTRAFYNCYRLKALDIPDSVTAIGSFVLEYADAVTEVKLGANVKSIGEAAFCGAAVKSITVDPANENYCSIDGNLYTKDAKTFLGYARLRGGSEFTVPDGVTRIAPYAFYMTGALKTVNLPDTLTSIGEGAFSTTGITSVTVPDSVKSIGESAFYYCRSLTSVTLPKGITEIASHMFFGCSKLVMEIPDTVTRIGTYAFSGCNALTVLRIPGSVAYIDSSAFNNCTGLTEVYIGEGVTHLSNGVFASCSNLTYVTIPRSMKYIGVSAFTFCNKLTTAYFNIPVGWYAVPSSGSGKVTLGTLYTYDAAAYLSNTYTYYHWYACDHNYVKTVTPPTCTNSGFTKNACSVCGHTFNSDITDPIPHVYGEGVLILPTCTERGYVEYKCTACNHSKHEDSTEPLGHAFDANEICTRCGVFGGVANGTCVDGLMWGLNTEGVLTVQGNGEMYDYKSGGAPWYSYRSQITKIVVKEGVTSIGNYAFSTCLQVVEVSLPESLTEIGDYAFSHQSALKRLNIPAAVTYIGNKAFAYSTNVETVNITDISAWMNITFASSESTPIRNSAAIYLNGELLTELVIPDSITEIKAYAFYDYDHLVSVTMGKGVTRVGEHAFNGCSNIKTVNVTDLAKWCEIVFVTSSANPASHCKGIHMNGVPVTVIDPGEGITRIGPYAFYDFVGIKSVTVPSTVTSIGTDAFYGCNLIAETHISDVAAWCGISFSNVYSTPVNYSKNLYVNGKLLTRLVIPESVTRVNAYAFYECVGLVSLEIHSGVQYMGNSAFNGCSKLVEIINRSTNVKVAVGTSNSHYAGYYAIEVHTGESKLVEKDGFVFYPYNGAAYLVGYNGEAAVLTLPANCNGMAYEVYKYAFNGNKTVTSVTVPDTVTAIGEYAFADCTSLKNAVLGNGVKRIDAYAFAYCDSLESIALKEGIESIGEFAFYYCDKLDGVVLPSTLTSLGESAFYGCSSLTSVSVPAGVKAIAYRTFYMCDSLKSVTLAAGLTTVDSYAFAGCVSLESISLPDTVSYVGGYAFQDCVLLTEIHIPLTAATVGSGVFNGCSSLVSISVPHLGGNVKAPGDKNQYPLGYYFGASSYEGGVKITQYYYGSSTTSPTSSSYCIPETLRCVTVGKGYINYGAFYGMYMLTDITLCEGVLGISSYSFQSCRGLTDIVVPDTVTSIGASAFSGCSSLVNMTVPFVGNTVVTEGAATQYPFGYIFGTGKYNGASPTEQSYRSASTSIGYTTGTYYIPDSLKSVTVTGGIIPYGAFSKCAFIEKVVIGDGVKSIGQSSFSGCSSLKYVTVGKSVTNIYSSAFNGCTAIVEVINNSRLSIKAGSTDHGYAGYYAIQVHTGESLVKEYGDFLFYSYNGVNYLIDYVGDEGAVTLPSDYNGESYVIYSHAFNNRTNVTSLTFTSGVTEIRGGAFSGCTALESVYIGSISDWMALSFAAADATPMYYATSLFVGGEALTELIIPDGVTGIERYQFYGFKDVTRVIIPKGVTVLGDGCFSGMTSLTSVELPHGVTNIGIQTFADCTALARVFIPATVTVIDSGAFKNCASLTEMTVPDSVTYLGSGFLAGCSSLESLTVPFIGEAVKTSGESRQYPLGYFFGTGSYVGGVSTTQYFYNSGTSSLSSSRYYIPASLVKVTVTGGRILTGAFQNCGNVTEIVLGDGILGIAKDAFNGSAPYLDGTNWENGVLYIGKHLVAAELDVSGDVTVKAGTLTVAEYAFQNCVGIISVTVPDSVKCIGLGAFSGCSSIESITLPFVGERVRGENELEQYPFGYVFGRLSYEGGISTTQYFYGYGTEYVNLSTFYIPLSLKNVTVTGGEILYGAFYNCSFIESITLPKGLTKIGGHAFYYCYYLRNITVPDGVTSIGANAFENCGNISSVNIPAGVTSIGNYAFKDCVRLIEVVNNSALTVTAGATDNGYVAYYAREVHSGRSNVTEKDGYIWLIGSEEIYLLRYVGEDTELVLPADWKGKGYVICDYAFNEMTRLTSVTVPNSVKSIGKNAFLNCTELINVYIVNPFGWSAGSVALDWETLRDPSDVAKRLKASYNSVAWVRKDGDTSGSIGVNISWVILEDGTLAITGSGEMPDFNAGGAPWNAYKERIAKVAVIGELSIGSSAFYGFDKIVEVRIADGLVSIGNYAFYGCTSLTEIVIPDSVRSIGAYAFRKCSSLTSVIFRNRFGWTAGEGSISAEAVFYPSDAAALITGDLHKVEWMRDASSEPTDTVAVICGGKGGASVKWVLTEDGKLTVVGSGAMFSYGENGAPWTPYADGVTALEIGEGITSIGDYAFYGFTALTELNIPSTVTVIGDYAFYRLGVGSLTVPASVTDIGNGAFGYSQFTVLKLNEGLLTVGDSAFYGCKIIDLSIPSTVTLIGKEAFRGNSSLTGVRIYGGKISDSAFEGCSKLLNAHLYDVTYIGARAFSRTDLHQINIPSSVTYIGAGAFYASSRLTYVYLNPFGWSRSGYTVSYTTMENEKTVANYMKNYDSYYWEKTWIDSGVSGEVEWFCFDGGILYITGEGAMADYSAGKAPWNAYKDEIVYLCMDSYIENIGSCSFYGFTKLNKLELPLFLKRIGDYAFFGCTALESFEMYSYVTEIGAYAFRKCSNLTSVHMAKIAGWAADGTYVRPEKLIFPDLAAKYLVSEYYTKTWTRNTNATTELVVKATGECGTGVYWILTSENELRVYGNGAMANYTASSPSPWSEYADQIVSVTVTGGVTQIGRYAFYNCKCTEVTLEEGVKSVGDYAFSNSAVVDLSLPSTLNTIASRAFSACASLKKLVIPNGVTAIDVYAFSGCVSIESITVNSANTVYRSSYNCIIDIKKKTIILGCKNSVIAKDAEVTAIGSNAFAGCEITSVSIPSTITKIGASAFYQCTKLSRITLPKGLTEIGASAFRYCNELVAFTVPATVKTIGAYAFADCDRFYKMTIPEGVEVIEDGLFYGCVFMTEVTLPSSVKSIGASAFYNCHYLTSVNLEGGLISIGSRAFQKCANLTEIVIPDSVTSIGSEAFRECTALKSVVIGKGVTSVGASAFYGCTAMVSAVISDSAASLGNYAFYDCRALESVSLGNGITSIGSYAFKNCSALKTLVIPDSVTSVGTDALSGCAALESLTVPFIGAENKTASDTYQYPLGYFFGMTSYTGGVKTQQNYCDSNTSGANAIASYYIPSVLKSVIVTRGDILTGAFQNCKYIEEVVLGNEVDVIRKSSFTGCTALKSLKLKNYFGWTRTYTPTGNVTVVDWRKAMDDAIMSSYALGSNNYNWKRTDSELVGSVNADIIWTILSDGTLAIYGSGDMPKYSAGKAPWSAYKDQITKVAVIGVSSIGNCSFYSLDKVTEIYIGDTVTAIGDYAFFGCTALSEITVPESVTSIGSYAFRKCSALTALRLSAIAGWTAGESYVAPKYLVFPDVAAEYFVSTNYAKLWSRNPRATTDVTLVASGECGNGVVWSISSENELRIAGKGAIPDYEQGNAPWSSYATTVTAISVGSGVTRVGSYAFCGFGSVDSVTLGLGIRTVGKYAFAEVGAFVINLPANLNNIEEYAFAGCGLTRLNIPASVNKIAPAAFYGCESLAIITVDSGNTYYRGSYNCIVDIRAKSIILGCKNSTVAKDPAVTSIGKYAFAGSGISSLKITSNITAIDGYAFADCRSLTALTVPKTLEVIGEHAFDGSAITVFDIPVGVKSVSDGVFKNCTALTSVTVPSTVTVIGEEAFRGCTSLESITVPASVSFIYGNAFTDSAILTLKLISPADWFCNGEKIPYEKLWDNDEAVRLFKSEYAGGVWSRDPAKSFPVSDTFGWELTRNGELFIYGVGCMPEYDAGKAPWSAYKDQYSTVIISEGITSVGKSAFYGLTNITEIKLPESIMVIEEYAFFGCNKIASIRIPAKVYTIGGYAMRKTAFTELAFANPHGWSVNGLAMGGDMAVFNAYLSGGKVNGASTDAYKYAFRRADNSMGNPIDGGAVAGGKITWSFSDTGILTLTGIGDMPGYTASGSPWYQYHNIVRRVIIGEGITSIGKCAFYTFVTLESVDIANTVTSIGGYAFYKCSSLTAMSIPESVVKIEAYAFRQCEATEIDLAIKYGWSAGSTKFSASELATAAADYLSKGYYKYEWVRDINAEYEDADPNYADGGMCNSTVKWKLVWLDEAKTQMKLTVYGNGAMPEYGTGSAPWYGYLDKIVEIEVEGGITVIGRCSFYNLSKVTKVTLHEGLVTIGAYAFNTCKGLKEIVIPSTVTKIDDTAFKKTGLAVIPTV